MNAMKRYVNDIERNLRMDRPTRVRIMRDLGSDIQSRREAGATDEQIMAELGTPQEVAESFNQAFGAAPAPARSGWRWAFLAAAAALLLQGGCQALRLRLMAGSSIGVIGGADGPTAIFVTGSVLSEGMLFLPVILGCLSVFCTLQWPGRTGWRGWLPTALAVAGILVWAVSEGVLAACLLPAVDTLGRAAGYLLLYLLKRFFTQGCFVPVLALAFALRRRRRGE